MKKYKVLLPTEERWPIAIHQACILASLVLATMPAQAVRFRLPLSSDTAVHYYYDHNSSSGITAWNCTGDSYNGHQGTDFSGGPRGRAIYAAANGTLNYKIDGFGDGYAGSPDGGGAGNHVRIDHGGGIMSWYMHMTVGSVTGKAVGSAMACSEQIGGVGTSGSSTGLHLHFDLRINGARRDPFIGGCGGLDYWVNQNGGHPTTACEPSGPPRGIPPSLVVSASGTTVFAVHSDTSVRYNFQNSGWVSLGGSSFYNVKGVLTPDNRLVVFGTGNGGPVWYNYQTAPGGSWSGWVNLGGGPFTSVKALVLADGRLAIFATSNSSALWHTYQTSPGGAWASWVNLGGSGFHHIDPVLLPDGKMVVFGAGDGSPVGSGTPVYHTYQTSGGGPWSGWVSLGGAGFTYVRGLVLSNGRMVVFGCGDGSTVYHQFQNAPGGSWSGWLSLGGSGFSTIDPVLMSGDRMLLFGTGPNSAVFHTFQSSAGSPWSGWISLGGSGFSTVDGGLLNDGRLVAFGNGNGGAFWYDGQTSAGGSWTGWINLGGTSSIP